MHDAQTRSDDVKCQPNKSYTIGKVLQPRGIEGRCTR